MGERQGIVIRIDSGGHHVQIADEVWRCRVRARLRKGNKGEKNPVAVGDQVLVVESGKGEGAIESVLDRRTRLTRPTGDGSGREQVIAANVDQVVIVASAREPPLRHAFIDRVLVAAERGGMASVICLNKVDLDTGGVAGEQMKVYEAIGYRVLHTSAARRQGLISLREALQGKTTVLAGHSGVGKSSLLVALSPGLVIKTQEVSVKTQKGRHTTTASSLIPLDFGGYVVDTPGVRAFGLLGLAPCEVAHYYPEMRPHIDHCRFKTCTHLREPGCAVQAAVERGEVSEIRFDSYAKILESIEAGLEGLERW